MSRSKQDEEEDYWAMRKKRDDEYYTYMETKASQKAVNLEWIVEREKSGNPIICDWNGIRFKHGQMGWLGNMTPAEEISGQLSLLEGRNDIPGTAVLAHETFSHIYNHR